jgi:hypothetical protein
MTPIELLPIIRRDFLDEMPDVLGDPESVMRWPRAFILREIGQAQRQACLRRDLRHLFDDTTAALCTVPLNVGQAAYALDQRVLRIDTARIGTVTLRHLTRVALDEHRPGWRTLAVGIPDAFYIEGSRLSLVPAPAVPTAPLLLAVWRLPLTEPNWTTPLEWPGEQSLLAHWVAYRAFLRPQPDTVSESLAKLHLGLFEQAFGPAVPERVRADLLAYPDTLNLLTRPAPRRTREEW